MKPQDRITISAVDTIQNLEQNLDKLRRFQYDSRYRSLLGDTIINHMESWDNRIRSRRKDPFTIVVAGEFKRGKSSFINALLGENILITDVAPETVTMNRLQYGIHKNEAVLSGGRRLSLDDSELSRSSLQKLMEDIGEPIRQLDLWRQNELLKDIRIIDTPGLNDISDEHLDSIVTEAMSQADAVIYIYSVTSPLSRSEQMFIRYAILSQQYIKLFLVGNYCDLLKDADTLNRMKKLMTERTKMLLSGENNYFISALEEMNRALNVERDSSELSSMLDEEFDVLKQDIIDLILEKKTTVTADRMQRMASQMVENLNNDIANIENGIKMMSEQISEQQKILREEESCCNQRLADAKSKVEQTVETMKQDTLNRTDMLLYRMEKEDLSVYSVQDISKYYSYYCVELIETKIRDCLESHRDELLTQLSEISDELSKGLAGQYATGDSVRFCFRVNNSTWTRGDSVTMAIAMVGSSAISSLADLVGSFTRKNELESKKDSLIDSIKKKYPSLKKQVAKAIDNQYSALSGSACKLIENYYQEQIDQARETVEQYLEVSEKSSEDKKQIIADLRQALSLLSETKTD